MDDFHRNRCAVHQAQVVVRLSESGKRARGVVDAHVKTVEPEVDAGRRIGAVVVWDGEVERWEWHQQQKRDLEGWGLNKFLLYYF